MATRRPKVYHTVEQLGAGSFGEVFLVTKTPPSRNWEMAAMKVIQSPGGNAFQEVDFLKRQQHPNIIKYYNSFKNKFGALCIVMEYCDRGTLTDFLSQVSWREEFNIWRCIWMLSSALAYLHRKNILHRDLKPDNILLKSEIGGISLKIADFGIAKLLNQRDQQLHYGRDCSAGTPIYMAPEALQHGERYTSSADIWALGAVISFIANGEHKFHSEYEVRNWDGRYRVLDRHSYSIELHELIDDLLSPDPNSRPSAQDCFDESDGKTQKPYFDN